MTEKNSIIEKIATSLKLLPKAPEFTGEKIKKLETEGELQPFPPFEQWDHWVEYDVKTWPAEKRSRSYSIVPTTCFNCEAACGMVAYVDKET
ncbi:MAG: hypothetical protein ACW98K_07515, partial [Candidatus Kariarchaeaceae archaeon]